LRRFVQENLIKKLPNNLQTEISEKIKVFKDRKNHENLKIHKLHGQLKNFWSFSVNYKYRIIFEYVSKNKVALLMVGDHDVYE